MAKMTISSVGRFVEGFQKQRFSVGLDVHKRCFSIALLRPDGMVKSWTTPADVAAITYKLTSLPIFISAVCYEAGPTGFGLARSLRSAGINVIVAAPSRIPRPITATNKSRKSAKISGILCGYDRSLPGLCPAGAPSMAH